jgi:cellulose synthase/poly-beta-1,6-N-acetylglucosamine synthase-like glycosyltransferase
MFIFTFICIFLLALYGGLIEYYRRAWKSIPVYTPKKFGPGLPATRISVILAARNEEENIAACLDSLFRQSYPKEWYQVIVLDDHSTDRTWEMLNSGSFPGMSLKPLRLGVPDREQQTPPGTAQLSPSGTDQPTLSGQALPGSAPTGSQPGKAYKKLAIETGILAAEGDLIVTTDADCLFHPDWLKTLAAFYEETGAKFIAAPVKIGGMPHSFLAIFQTLDFISLQGITGAAVHKRFHSMCNGANLAYEKKVFFEVDGFRGIDSIPSGDDMLLMHKIYRKYPEQVLFLKNRQAIVSTNPERTWAGFVNQRVRWASKADRYDDKRIFWVLLLVYIVNVLFVAMLLASCWNSLYLWLLLILLVIKTMVEYPFVRSAAVFFGQQKLLIYFPGMAPFHVLYTVVIGWLGKFGSYRWKERKNK